MQHQIIHCSHQTLPSQLTTASDATNKLHFIILTPHSCHNWCISTTLCISHVTDYVKLHSSIILSAQTAYESVSPAGGALRTDWLNSLLLTNINANCERNTVLCCSYKCTIVITTLLFSWVGLTAWNKLDWFTDKVF